MDLVDEHDRVGIGLDLLDDLLQPLLEIAAIARAGEQRAHIEGKHCRAFEHIGDIAIDDSPGEPLGDRRLADAGIADEQRIVLLASAQHLDGAADFDIAPDQRIDLAVPRLLVEIDAISFQSIALFLAVVLRLAANPASSSAARAGRASVNPGRFAIP